MTHTQRSKKRDCLRHRRRRRYRLKCDTKRVITVIIKWQFLSIFSSTVNLWCAVEKRVCRKWNEFILTMWQVAWGNRVCSCALLFLSIHHGLFFVWIMFLFEMLVLTLPVIYQATHTHSYKKYRILFSISLFRSVKICDYWCLLWCSCSFKKKNIPNFSLHDFVRILHASLFAWLTSAFECLKFFRSPLFILFVSSNI